MAGNGKRVAVLMGGWSAEREVSLVSGNAVAKALRERGYQVTPVDVGPHVGVALADLQPEVVFNALHGRFGEDGCIQGVLEMMGLPYTHSGVLASALAMDKPSASALFRDVGIRTPEGRIAHRDEVIAGAVMDAPYVVKPTNEGSSVGVVIVMDGDDNPFADGNWEYRDNQVLVERYVPGRELAVAVMNGEALGVAEIKVTGHGFYDYNAKYRPGGSVHEMPAKLSPAARDACLRISEEAHRRLRCRGVTRVDLRYDEQEGEVEGLYVLEINTQPGMTPTSLVPEIAAHKGMNFGALVEWIVEDAGCRR
ncbi:MAG: D-alanine--D-alanine ligase [Alphaproteobacteria bacterium]|nr:D-alanine--D-alanine ligase [Alphaproteobacteria bacterium]